MKNMPPPLMNLIALLAFALACMPLASPMLTEEPGFSSGTVGPLPRQTREVSTGLPAVTVEMFPTHAPTAAPRVPVTLVLAGNAFSRDALSVLGGYRDGAWLAPEQAADFIDIDGEVRLFTLDGVERAARITSISREDGPVEQCNQPEYTLRLEGDVQPLSVGLNLGWPANPRPVEWLSSQNEYYLQAVAEHLQTAGASPAEAQIRQILKADLDGNGADEVLVAASRFLDPSGHGVAPGDYSLILMRVLVDGEVVTRRVIGEVHTHADPLAFPPTYSIQGLLDVNADGRMDLLVYRQVWEGHGTILFQMEADQLQEALRLVCGS